MFEPAAAQVEHLGPRRVPSPLSGAWAGCDFPDRFVSDSTRIPLHIETNLDQSPDARLSFEKAGPRERIYFAPSEVRAGIVTCGGLCPGLNNVIRSVVLQLHFQYGCRSIAGFRYGYHGLDPRNGLAPLTLTPDLVTDIHEHGGTILGTSRGPVDPDVMAAYLAELGINALFTVGGDGTQRGALTLAEAARRRGHPLALIGIPKTVDNDIMYVWRTFGYMTAIAEARNVIDSAHNEARAVRNGIGLVRLMGRESGFIAAGATLASQEVNFCLIPEVPFELEGPQGFLAALSARLRAKSHAVIVVAEGAGQPLLPRHTEERDASGNVKFADIGPFLRARIEQHLKAEGVPFNLRYIDPSYIIRSRPANTEDALLCDQLARHAVHAAMAGKTNLVIGYWYDQFVHVPIPLASSGRKRIEPWSAIWTSVLAATGQPARFGPPVPPS
jgi:6-phosphofructokinase 1